MPQVRQPQARVQKPMSYSASKRLQGSKQKEFQLVSDFKYGYRNREDKTNMPIGVLVEGSKNVLTNVSERIQIRKGYTLDGPSSTDAYPITAAYTFVSNRNYERNLRAYLPTSSTGVLQYRYVASDGTVTWRTLLSSLTSTSFNFTTWWDSTELKAYILAVNGTARIYEWSSAVTTASASSTSASVIGTVATAPTVAGNGYTVGDILTITTGGTRGRVRVATISGGLSTGPIATIALYDQGTGGYSTGAGKVTSGGTGSSATVEILTVATASNVTTSGTLTWNQLGFYTSHTGMAVTINGTSYTYTGGNDTTILTGLSADPTANIAVDPIVHQTPITTANTAMTGLPLSQNDLIEVFNGHLFVGSFIDQTIYCSKIDDYKTYTISDINATNFGKVIRLDSPPVSFNKLENSIAMSAGKNQWYNTTISKMTYTDDTIPAAPVVYDQEVWTTNPLKTNSNAAAQSQALVSSIKNDLVFVSNEPTMDTLGRVENILGTVQTANISDSIKLDFDAYDFTGGSVFYSKYFIYLAIPQEGLVRIYNLKKAYWEAPQTMPVSRFYTVDGILYGHSSLTSESYKLFDGRADRADLTNGILGAPIPAVAKFSFQNYGTRNILKNFNEYYVEGYISSNTTLDAGVQYDLDGCATTVSYPIVGTASYVCIPGSKASLGKESIGKNPLGGDLITSNSDLPPKFRVVKTFPSVDFFENQFTFDSNQTNAIWEILSFGPAVRTSPSIANSIRD